MDNDWLEYKETRRDLKQRKPRVILSNTGALTLNAKAFEMLGDPAAIRLLFDVQNSRIGVRREDAEVEHALPIRKHGVRGVVHIGGFCKKFSIRIETTIEFSNVRTDPDGTMVLDMRTARRLSV